MILVGNQALMNYSRACFRHLNVALVAIPAQDGASRQQGLQRRFQQQVRLVQQHRITLSPISVQRYQCWHQRHVATTAMSPRWSWSLASPLERPRGKHLIRLHNPGQPGCPRGQGITKEPVSPPKRSFQIDSTCLGRHPQRETLAEAVGVLVVQPRQRGLV